MSTLETAKQALDAVRTPGAAADALENKVADFLKKEVGGLFGAQADAVHGDSRSQLQVLRDNVDLRRKFFSGLSTDERKAAEEKLGGVGELAAKAKEAQGALSEAADKAKLASAAAVVGGAGAAAIAKISAEAENLRGKSGMGAAEAGMGFFEKSWESVRAAMASVMTWFAATFPKLASWLGISESASGASAQREAGASASEVSAEKPAADPASKRVEEELSKFDAERFAREQQASLEKAFTEKYGVEFDEGRRSRLAQLLKESAADAKNLVDVPALKEKFQKEGVSIGDAYPIISGGVLSSAKFLTLLVGRNIVPASALGVELVHEGTRQVVLTLDALGIRHVLSPEAFAKIVGEMNEQEKMTALALLYRKGGMLFSALGALSYYATYLPAAFATHTAAVGYKVFPRAMLNDYRALAKDFAAIEKEMGVVAGQSGAKLLQDAVENTAKISRNYQWLDIQGRCGGSPSKFLELCQKEGAAVPEEVRLKVAKIGEGAEASERLGKALASEMEIIETKPGVIKTIAGKFAMNQTGRMVVYEEHLNDVAKMQRRLAVGGDGFARLRKPLEAMRVSQVSRVADHMVWSFRSQADLKATVRELATSAPEVLRGLFDKMPIFAVAGVAMASDEPMIESLKKEWQYLIPVWGPILLIGRGGLDADWKPKNMGDLLAGSALLTFDGYHLIKGGLPGAAKYVFKPVVDVYEIAQMGTRVSWAGARAAGELLGGARFAEFLENAVKSGPGRLAKWTALAALIVWGGYELLKPGEREEIEKKYGIKEGDTLAALTGEDRDRMAETAVREALRREGFSGATVTAANGTVRVSAEGVRPEAAGHLTTVAAASLLQCGLDGYEAKAV